MKKIFIIAFVTVAASVAFSGCIKETFPTSVASNEQVNASPTALEAMVNGMAAFINNLATVSDSAHYDWGYRSIMIIREAMGEDFASIASSYEWYNAWMRNQYQGDGYLYGQFIWNFFTQFLLTANSVIGAVDENTENAQQAAYLAMAFCYRSMINLDMGQMYEFKKNSYTTALDLEGKTIPIIKENMTEEEARHNPRVDKDVLLNTLIIPDLEKAIKLFGGATFETDKDKSKIFKRSAVTQPDLSVAYGLLARANMWKADYAAAKKYAQLALDAGAYTPLSESQWTDTTNGFNNISSQSSWMWGTRTMSEDDVVKTGILNWPSWMSSETSFGYASAGPIRLCAKALYDQIPASDFRKKSWVAPAGSGIEVPMVAATDDYDPTVLPELAAVKFRPGSGNPDDSTVGAVTDLALMRCEEMYFIIAECDARNGSKASLESFMQTYRDKTYTCKASDLVEEVLLQKRIEFWGEGVIYFDYKRLNHSVTRGYAGTNFAEDRRFNTIGLAPWMNFCTVQTEHNANEDFVSNPDPSDLVELWTE